MIAASPCDGPLGGPPGYDAAIQALSGIMSVNGEADGAALRVGLPVVDMLTGLKAALGIMFALNERAASGRGQFVEAALYDCGLSLLHPHAANHFLDGRTPQRTGNAHPNIYPYDAAATGREPIFLAVGNDRQFATLCETIGAAELPRDPRFASNGARSTNRDALKAALEAKLATHDGKVLAETLVRAGVPCVPIQSVPQALAHPHTAHRAPRDGGSHRRRLHRRRIADQAQPHAGDVPFAAAGVRCGGWFDVGTRRPADASIDAFAVTVGERRVRRSSRPAE